MDIEPIHLDGWLHRYMGWIYGYMDGWIGINGHIDT